MSRTQRSLKLNLEIIAMRGYAWVYPNTQGSIFAILAHTHTHSLTYSHIHIFICIKSWPCPEICWTGNCFNTPEIAGELHKLTRNAPWAQSNVMRPRHQCGQRGKRKCCHCVCVWECGGVAFYWVLDGGASKELKRTKKRAVSSWREANRSSDRTIIIQCF